MRNIFNRKYVTINGPETPGSVALFNGSSDIMESRVLIDSLGNITTPGTINASAISYGDDIMTTSITAANIYEKISGQGLNIAGLGVKKQDNQIILTCLGGLKINSGSNAVILNSVSGPASLLEISGSAIITGNADVAGYLKTSEVRIGANSVLNATSLGSAIVNSSLTSVGNLTAGSISSGFGNITSGSLGVTGTNIRISGNAGNFVLGDSQSRVLLSAESAIFLNFCKISAGLGISAMQITQNSVLSANNCFYSLAASQQLTVTLPEAVNGLVLVICANQVPSARILGGPSEVLLQTGKAAFCVGVGNSWVIT